MDTSRFDSDFHMAIRAIAHEMPACDEGDPIADAVAGTIPSTAFDKEVLDDLATAGLIARDARSGDIRATLTGHQFAGRPESEFPVIWMSDVLWFMSESLDDLVAREAVMRAGRRAVDDLEEAILSGEGVAYVREMASVYAEPFIDDRAVLYMYSATVAMVARLVRNEEAACPAEWIVVHHLVRLVHEELDAMARDGEIRDDELAPAFEAAREELLSFVDEDQLDYLLDSPRPSDEEVAHVKSTYEVHPLLDWVTYIGVSSPTGHIRPAVYADPQEN
jgi:hypothetical protein